MHSKFVNIFVQKSVDTTVPKLKFRILLLYLGSISSITKKKLNRCISKRTKFCKLKIIFGTGNRLLDLKIVFLKSFNLTLSINLSLEATQLPITVKLTDIRRFWFQNIRVCLLDQVIELKEYHPRQ